MAVEPCRAGCQEQSPKHLPHSRQPDRIVSSHPLESEAGPFAGEARCAECHGEIFEAQQASRHSSTLLRGTELAEIPYPDQPIADPDDPKVSHVFRREADQIRFETHVKDEVKKAVVEYAFGSRDHYASLVGADDHGSATRFEAVPLSIRSRFGLGPDDRALGRRRTRGATSSENGSSRSTESTDACSATRPTLEPSLEVGAGVQRSRHWL